MSGGPRAGNHAERRVGGTCEATIAINSIQGSKRQAGLFTLLGEARTTVLTRRRVSSLYLLVRRVPTPQYGRGDHAVKQFQVPDELRAVATLVFRVRTSTGERNLVGGTKLCQ